MRKLFSRQLIEARHEMLSIYEAVDLALHDAVKAYVTDDRKLATKTKKRTLSIDARCANLEAVCYNLIATQSPVASDFRLLQTIIYVDFNLQRMTDKVRQICRATRHMVKADISLPKELVGTVEAEAEAVYQVLGSSLSALVTNDMSIICNLAVEDEPVPPPTRSSSVPSTAWMPASLWTTTVTMTTCAAPSWSRAISIASPRFPSMPPAV
ncbi:MAG: phosphate signaling complex PhoU family protein [Collinsella sp.]